MFKHKDRHTPTGKPESDTGNQKQIKHMCEFRKRDERYATQASVGTILIQGHGSYGDWVWFPFEYSDNLHILPEIDGCRVVMDSSIEILQRVPPATALLLRIGSIKPSAMLLDACDAFEASSHSSDEAAQAITKTWMLVNAIETCTEAATE